MAKSNGSASINHGTNGHTNRVSGLLPTTTPAARDVQIAAPNMQVAAFKIRGTTPYVQNKFSGKGRDMMKAAQEAGSVGKKGKKREPKDFKKCFEAAMYVGPKGEHGIPCGAFRRALVSACRTVGFTMTHAKIGLFIMEDFYDESDIGSPLVKIAKGKPEYFEATVRNASGVVDIRARPMWKPGWEATVTIRFDGDMFTVQDVANLLSRAGEQIGIGEGRPDSKDSCGMGWGLFQLIEGK